MEKSKPVENTIGKAGRRAGLTNRQREFARYYVEGKYSNAECARMAGYVDTSANNHAAKLLDGKSFPEVPELIKELREARERKYGVTVLGQLKRFEELSMSAEEAGQFSAAINAEKIRSSLGGLTIDRRESTHVHQLDNMSREDIVARDPSTSDLFLFDGASVIEISGSRIDDLRPAALYIGDMSGLIESLRPAACALWSDGMAR